MKFPKRKNFIFFVLSSFLILFFSLFSFVFYPFVKYVWGQNDRYCIQTIIQRKPPQDSLKSSYIAEVLGLSTNKKNYLYHFKLNEGEEKLKKTIIIKDACIKKIKPSTLFVEYTLRKPIAFIGSHGNVSIDNEGIFIPFSPFYTPKNLPELYIATDAEEIIFGKKMNGEVMTLVQEFLNMFPPYSIQSLDLSKIDAPTLGQREIVLKIKNEHFLRLTPRGYKTEIQEYFLLKEKAPHSLKECSIIDLRIPHVAFLGGKNETVCTNSLDVP